MWLSLFVRARGVLKVGEIKRVKIESLRVSRTELSIYIIYVVPIAYICVVLFTAQFYVISRVTFCTHT